MKPFYTTQELVTEACRRIENFLDTGLCVGCALLLAARYYDCDQEKLETLWLDWKAKEVAQETA